MRLRKLIEEQECSCREAVCKSKNTSRHHIRTGVGELRSKLVEHWQRCVVQGYAKYYRHVNLPCEKSHASLIKETIEMNNIQKNELMKNVRVSKRYIFSMNLNDIGRI